MEPRALGAITFLASFPGLPQPRQKFRVVRGRQVVPYTEAADPIHQYKADIRGLAKAALRSSSVKDKLVFPTDEPIQIKTVYLFSRNGLPDHFENGRIPAAFNKTCNPDLDNLDKALWDALTGVVWEDDRQIYRSSAEKFHTAIGEKPGVLTVISFGY